MAGDEIDNQAEDESADNTTDSAETQAAPQAFPIIGIGASAGGLEAIQGFLNGLPDDPPGMAFVVVSHLDPSQNSILAELLQKHTLMEVRQIEDGMTVSPDRVYVIPPNRDLQLDDDRFRLTPISRSIEHRAPITLFFRSLAEKRGEMAAGIILSGMGSDGAAGLKAVKGQLGAVLVQDPNEAKYDGMPRAAIGAGVADFVLPAGEMPKALIEYFRRVREKDKSITDEPDKLTLHKIHNVLRTKSGHDFSHYKESTVRRRINRRIDVHGLQSSAEYVQFLRKDPEEAQALVKELLIGVTQFFRDPEAFEALKEGALPKLLADRAEGQTLRVWVAGCASGEEAFSVAILLNEYIGEHELDLDYQIFATDLDEEAVVRARSGVYAGDIVRDVSPGRLKKFFRKKDDHYQIESHIRERIVFAPHSVIKDPPFTHLDLLVCRNLLIYLDREIQEKLGPIFHYSLNPGGILFLGHSETISHLENRFEVLDDRWKIYRRKRGNADPNWQVGFPFSTHKYTDRSHPSVRPASIAELSERVLLDRFTPPAVIVDRKGEIRYIHGRVYKFLEHGQGVVRGYNLFEMARAGLRIHLLTVMRRIGLDSEPEKTVVRVGQNGDTLDVRVTVSPLGEGDGRGLFVVMFEEVPVEERQYPRQASTDGAKDDEPGQVRDLKASLMVCEEKLHTTVEELESTNEELRSLNEEYLSANEELQSANEELSSSREELQSLNEELETVNSELHEKVRQVEKAYAEMRSMLDSLKMPVIFLDKNLCIKRFSSNTGGIMELIQSDVGRPIDQLRSKIAGLALEQEARRILRGEPVVEKEVTTRDGDVYLVRFLPYPAGKEDEAGGVVISFVEVSELKLATERLSEMTEARIYAQAIIDTLDEPLIVLDRDMIVRSASRAFFKKFRVADEEIVGKSLFALGDGQWDIPELKRLLEQILPEEKVFEDYEVEHDFPTIGRRKMLLNARTIEEPGAAPQNILLALQDITEGM